jgi:hypothetical protein
MISKCPICSQPSADYPVVNLTTDSGVKVQFSVESETMKGSSWMGKTYLCHKHLEELTGILLEKVRKGRAPE